MVADPAAAERYAGALFEIARLLHRDTEIEEELGSFSAALRRSPEVEKFLQNPRLSPSKRREFLGKIYQVRSRDFYGVLLNFFSLLFEKGRFHLVHDIADIFKKIADEKRGIGTAQIKTAVPLDARTEAALLERIERIAGYKIRMQKEVDPSLVGGVVVKIRNKVLDGSVRYKIRLLKQELTKIRAI